MIHTWLLDAHKIMIRKSKKEKNGYRFFFGVFYMYNVTFWIHQISWVLHFTLRVPFSSQAPVVQMLDNPIQRISVDKTNLAIHWIVIYLVNSVIPFSNNRGPVFKLWELANLTQGVTLWWTSIPSSWRRNTPGCLILHKWEITACVSFMGDLTCGQTTVYLNLRANLTLWRT